MREPRREWWSRRGPRRVWVVGGYFFVPLPLLLPELMPLTPSGMSSFVSITRWSSCRVVVLSSVGSLVCVLTRPAVAGSSKVRRICMWLRYARRIHMRRRCSGSECMGRFD